MHVSSIACMHEYINRLKIGRPPADAYKRPEQNQRMPKAKLEDTDKLHRP